MKDASFAKWLAWNIDFAEKEGIVEARNAFAFVLDCWNEQHKLWEETYDKSKT